MKIKQTIINTILNNVTQGTGYTREAGGVVRLEWELERLSKDSLYMLDLLLALRTGTYTSQLPPVVGEPYKELPNKELLDAMLPPLDSILEANAPKPKPKVQHVGEVCSYCSSVIADPAFHGPGYCVERR